MGRHQKSSIIFKELTNSQWKRKCVQISSLKSHVDLDASFRKTINANLLHPIGSKKSYNILKLVMVNQDAHAQVHMYRKW